MKRDPWDIRGREAPGAPQELRGPLETVGMTASKVVQASKEDRVKLVSMDSKAVKVLLEKGEFLEMQGQLEETVHWVTTENLERAEDLGIKEQRVGTELLGVLVCQEDVDLRENTVIQDHRVSLVVKEIKEYLVA